MPAVTDGTAEIRALAQRRWRIAITLTVVMVFIYFGFISLVAFNKEFMGRRLGSGLSVGILLGALVIVASWLLTWFYVRWSNTHYDAALGAIGRQTSGGPTR
jgi:uncharacterized membrane protein (DUF485 family)